MRGVAISADGSVGVALGKGFAVDAQCVLGVDSGVAASAGFGNVDLVGRTQRVFAAEDVVRAVAALAVGGDEQAFLIERVAVDGVDVLGKNLGESMLLSHAVVAVTFTAGFGDIERIDSRPGVSFGNDLMCIAVATGAGMLSFVGVNASDEARSFISVAALAIDGLDLVWMGESLDVGVAITTSHAAVNAGVEELAINIDAFAGRVLGGLVVVASEAIGLSFGDT